MRAALARLSRSGLRLRLAAWVAGVMLVCTAITFVAVYRGTGTQLRTQIDRALRGDVASLAHNLAATRERSPQGVAQAAAHYIQTQPFSASSTLLFALVPGAATSSNRPELFAPAGRDGETPAQQYGESIRSAELLVARAGYSTLPVADLGDLRLLKGAVRLHGGLTVTLGAAQALEPVAHAQASVARAFVLAGALALVGALLGAYLIGTRISRPLRRMASVAARVDAGELHPRIGDPGVHGNEVRVLAEAFDHMLERLDAAFAGQREFVADASHELRTPLTVIKGQLEVLAAERHPSPQEVRRVERLAQAEIARVGRLVDDLLLLARSEHAQFLRPEAIDLPSYVSELWAGVELLAERSFELESVPHGTLHADPDRLAQALRNLLANAIAHTEAPRGLVRLRIEQAGAGHVRFLVEDDGPGIAVGERERVFDRFNRTDTARDRASGGTGLGLAIVRAIAKAHGGRVIAGESAAGGARLELELPRFAPAPVPSDGGARGRAPTLSPG
ncbi:MAG TPA: ATP-binding protein [Solirubrobacteraceae bacterium]|nr:ATP-binding protein [Solirubrobacteraceae bacterium]